MRTTETNYSVPPGEYLLEWCEYNNFSIEETAIKLGLTTQEMAEFITGRTKLTDDFAEQLEQVTRVPARSWKSFEDGYQRDEKRLRKTRYAQKT